MTSPQQGIPPLDPRIKARRKRTNRIVAALIVMVLLPVGLWYAGRTYIASDIDAWAKQPTFAANATTTVTLKKPGDYAVWSYPVPMDSCLILNGGMPVIPKPASSTNTMQNIGGFVSGYEFHAAQAGDYTVTCLSPDPQAYGFISTESPLVKATGIMLVTILLAGAAFITGAVLLIVGLVTNSHEKNAERASQQRWGAGPPPMYPGQYPPNYPPNPPQPWYGQPTTGPTPPWPPQG